MIDQERFCVVEEELPRRCCASGESSISPALGVDDPTLFLNLNCLCFDD